MNESEKQFSFTRAASITSGRAKNQIPISNQTLAILRDALLPKLLSGELSVAAAAKRVEART